jgi:hypothetical protein
MVSIRLLLENTIVGKLFYIYISPGVVALGYRPVKSYNLDTRSEEPYLFLYHNDSGQTC